MFTGSGDVVVPGSHFANHWAGAWEAREKEGVGSESRDHIMEDLITNIRNLNLSSGILLKSAKQKGELMRFFIFLGAVVVE